MCVCVCVSVCVCVCVCMFVYVCARARAYMSARDRQCVSACLCGVYVCVWGRKGGGCACVHNYG